MVTIDRALQKVKANVADLLSVDSVFEICTRLGHTWRDTPLNPAATLHLFIMQILAGNTAITNLRHLSGMVFTPAPGGAYCQARKRLPVELIAHLARKVGRSIAGQDVEGLWRGHRLWLADGSSASMPDTPELREHFGYAPGQVEGCGFPVASVLLLVHAWSGAIADMLIRPLAHDVSGVAMLHAALRAGDVLAGDRGFCSYAHLALLFERRIHGVFRIHQRIKVSFKPGRAHARPGSSRRRKGLPTSRWVMSLGPRDQIVQWFRPAKGPGWMSEAQHDALPASILVRELRYDVGRRGFRVKEVTLATTLLEADLYPAAELADRFLERWLIEGDLDHLKTTMGAAVLKCKTVEGVVKELWAFVLVYNLVRRVTLDAAKRQGEDPRRVSFIDALRWLAAAREDAILYPLIINPMRPGRVEPRVIKRRMKKFPLMQKPRHVLKQELLNKRVAA